MSAGRGLGGELTSGLVPASCQTRDPVVVGRARRVRDGLRVERGADVVSNGTRRTVAGAATCRPRVGVAQGAGRSGGSRWAVPLEARGGGRRRGARRSSVVVRFGELVGGRVLGRGRPSTVVARALSAPRCRSPDTSPARGFPRDSRPRPVHERPPTPHVIGRWSPRISASTFRPGTGTLQVARARRRDRGVLGSQTPPQPPWPRAGTRSGPPPARRPSPRSAEARRCWSLPPSTRAAAGGVIGSSSPGSGHPEPAP